MLKASAKQGAEKEGNMLSAYLQERYPEVDLTQWVQGLNDMGMRIYKASYGFFTYKAVGDSLIIGDIYVKIKDRASGRGRELFEQILKTAREANCSLLIGFSEHGGTNQQVGRAAMKLAGFKRALELTDYTVFFRGI